MIQTDEDRQRWGRIERLTASPDVLAASSRAVMESDVTSVLPSIQAQTLAMSRRGDRHIRYEHGRDIACRIPDARFVELAGDDHSPFAGRTDELLDEIEEFLTGTQLTPVLDRVLVTVLFTDIVGSTAACCSARRPTLARVTQSLRQLGTATTRPISRSPDQDDRRRHAGNVRRSGQSDRVCPCDYRRQSESLASKSVLVSILVRSRLEARTSPAWRYISRRGCRRSR